MYDTHNGSGYKLYSSPIMKWQPNGEIKVYDNASLRPVLCTDSASTITASMTFNVLPQSSVTPTNNNHLTNKAYVDSAIASAITTTLGGSY